LSRVIGRSGLERQLSRLYARPRPEPIPSSAAPRRCLTLKLVAAVVGALLDDVVAGVHDSLVDCDSDTIEQRCHTALTTGHQSLTAAGHKYLHDAWEIG
jgi:hypothetical protein